MLDIYVKKKLLLQFCNAGDLKSLEKLLTEPNIDVNGFYDKPIKAAITNGHINIVKRLLQHPNIKTDYENRKELRTYYTTDNNIKIKAESNPFIHAMMLSNYEIMDLIKAHKDFKLHRIETLDVLVQWKNKEMNSYFLKQPGFDVFIVSYGDKYLSIFSDGINNVISDIFLF